MTDVDVDLLNRASVRLAVDGEVATITLDRPEVLNAQTPSTWTALEHIGERLAPEVLIVVVRPVVVWLCLWRTSLRPGERGFVGLVGLKGAVPVLLGTLVLSEHVAQGPRLYAIIVAVVVVSVVGQGATVPFVARRCGVPMRTVEPEPWAFGVRLRENAEWARRYVVAPGSPADSVTSPTRSSSTTTCWCRPPASSTCSTTTRSSAPAATCRGSTTSTSP